MSNIVHAGFLINVPAHGNRGAREALRRQPFWWSGLIPQFMAEAVCAVSPDSVCYFGPAPEITCYDGTIVIVHVLAVPATTTALLSPRHPFHKLMTKRLADSCERLLKLSGEDLKVLGLGAATAIAGDHGVQVFKANQRLPRPIPIITNGNTITAGLSVEIGCESYTHHTSIGLKEIGIAGGFGSVGSRVATTAARAMGVKRVIIVTRHEQGNHDQRLAKLREECPQTQFVTGSLQEVMSCNLSFLAASETEPLPINPDWLPKAAVVIDIGKPLNTSPNLARQRPDVFIVDGSLAKLPLGTDWSSHCARMALPKNGVFGCLAETITLARLYANGELDDHVNKRTFIGRPDGEMAQRMVIEASITGLKPLILPAHRR